MEMTDQEKQLAEAVELLMRVVAAFFLTKSIISSVDASRGNYCHFKIDSTVCGGR